MTSGPLVCAVVVPAYRATRWILACLDSIAAQEPLDGWRYEVRIAVDACHETSALLLEAGVAHWWSATNVGPYLLRNALIRLAPADAYATFDADDMMEPAYLRSLLPILGNGVAGSGRYGLDEKGNRGSKPYPYVWGVSVFSAHAMNKLGGFRPWRIAADLDAILRARKLGLAISKHPDPLFLRRSHPNQLTVLPATASGSKERKALYRESRRLIRARALRVTPQCATLVWRDATGPRKHVVPEPDRLCAVVMAAFGASRWILEAVESVRSQEPLEGWRYELRIGVDGCEDTSKTLLDAGIGHWWSDKNVGPYLIRNALIRHQPADAYAVFDADDVMLPHYLRTLLPVVGDGIAGGGRYEVNEQGECRSCDARYWGGGVAVYSQVAMNKLGAFRPWRMIADWDAFSRASVLMKNGQPYIPVTTVDEATYLRRYSKTQLTTAKKTGIHSKSRNRLKAESRRLTNERQLYVEPECADLKWRAA